MLSSVLRAVLGKDMSLSHGKGKNQSFKKEILERGSRTDDPAGFHSEGFDPGGLCEGQLLRRRC